MTDKIREAIDRGGGQGGNVEGVLRELEKAGVILLDLSEDKHGNAAVLQKLNPGEPFFVLRGQDRLSLATVRSWANAAEAAGVPKEKVDNARACGWAMQDYHPKKIPD